MKAYLSAVKVNFFVKVNSMLFVICILGIISCGTDEIPEVIEVMTDKQIDSLALMSLYDSTDGANWRETWDTSRPMGEWFGIELNTDGTVGGIELPFNKLIGSLPADVTNFTNLHTLILSYNSFTGDLPSDLGVLNKLRTLSLDGSGFTGPLPASVTNIGDLETLNLAENNLSGSVPAGLGEMNKLRILDLSSNRFIGPLPADLADLENITFIKMDSNEFSGCFPAEYMDLCNVAVVEFDGNTAMPWNGDFDLFCSGEAQVGSPCTKDGEAGVIDSNCECKI